LFEPETPVAVVVPRLELSVACTLLLLPLVEVEPEVTVASLLPLPLLTPPPEIALVGLDEDVDIEELRSFLP